MYLILTLAVIIIFVFINKNQRTLNKPKSNLLTRFKKSFKNKNRLREKLSEDFSNHLMKDPEINITIGLWHSEIELKEKANIHRSRLSKFGRSRMNGEMLFLGPKGGVYKLTYDGKKKYV